MATRKNVREDLRSREPDRRGQVPNYKLLLENSRKLSNEQVNHVIGMLYQHVGFQETHEIGGHASALFELVKAHESAVRNGETRKAASIASVINLVKKAGGLK